MEKALTQKKNFEIRNFILKEKSLKVEYKAWSEEKSWEIPLDEIGYQKYYKKESKTPRIIALIFIGTVLLFANLGIFLSKEPQDLNTLLSINILFGLIGVFFAIKKIKKEIIIIGGKQSVFLFLDSPDKDTVEKYANQIIKLSKEYTLKKYAKIDPDLPEDTQMNILSWLKSRDLLSDLEYEELKQEYKTSKLL